jgi:Flp pilus assembly protein TadD
MTIKFTPNLSNEVIDQMDPFEAFRTAEQLLEDRFPRDGARVARKVVEAAPQMAAAWELLGRCHFAAAQLAPAEAAFRRLVELEPTSAWAHTSLGLSLDRQSRHREGAVHHRMAAAMGADAQHSTHVELVERPLD